MTIQLNAILRGVADDSPLRGLHRVLWVEDDLIVTIPIPVRMPGEPSVRYWKKPQRHSLSVIRAAIDEQKLIVTSLDLPPLVYLTDEQIKERYPQRSTPTKRRVRENCALLQKRDRAWRYIEPVFEFVMQHPAEAYRSNRLWIMVKDRALAVGRSPAELLDALHRCLALGCGKNSLLPATPRCGAKGRPRKLKLSKRLGRKNTAYVRGQVDSPGIHLSAKDKEKINIGWRTFLKGGRTVHQAHVLTLGAWWSTGTKIESGVEVPILMPPERCPTLKQFRYWGPREEGGKSAFELHLRPNDWVKKYRAMLGTSLDGITGVGQIALMDSTSTDQTLVSMMSPLDAVGTCNRIVIHDGLSDVICGIYCGFEAPSEQTALLTILNAASDKVEFCKRFDIQVTAEQFPSVFFRKFRVDNGEMRTENAIKLLTGLHSSIEFVERDRPERKGPVETGHHTIHHAVDKKGDGRTHGRQRLRGEDHSAVRACWTWYGYMRELLLAIIYFNNQADATALFRRHPFRVEMLRDNVPPNRAAIYAWCVKNNRVSQPYCDFELLRAIVLPVARAVVRQDGVFLLRPDRGEKKEIVYGVRFSGPRIIELGWHRGTASPPPYINVRYDPNNLDRIWYPDELGVHCLDNLTADQTLLRQATFTDCLDTQDREQVKRVLGEERRNQGLSDLTTHIENTNLQYRGIKKQALSDAGRKVSKSELKAGISENRAREIGLMAQTVDAITRTPSDTAGEQMNRSPSEADVPDNSSPSGSDSIIEKGLAAYRRSRREQ